MATADCKFTVHFSMSFCTSRTSFRKTEPLLSYRPQPLSTSRSNTPSSNSPPPAVMACVQRGAFALVRSFKSLHIALRPTGSASTPHDVRLPYGPELFYHVGLWQLFQLLARGLVDVFFSRGFSHAGLIHFLLDASECRLVGFLLGIVFMHTCTMSRVQRDYRSIWNRTARLQNCLHTEQF